jgi:gliding motility-associated-like protein
MLMRKFLLFLLLCISFFISSAQDFSNKGKEFWLCSPTHVDGSNLATLSIFITSDQASSGTITMPNNAFSATFNIAANGIQEIKISLASYPNVKIRNLESDQVLKKSIHIQVDNGKAPVVAYAQQWAGARSAATLLLPTNVLSTKYYAVSFSQNGSASSTTGDPAKSQFQIIAIKDNTVVQITPKANGILQAPFVITLPLAGDMYQYQDKPDDTGMSNVDLTGSYIESLASGLEGCHPIAVFSGSSNTAFGIAGCGGGNSYDPLWQQLYPVSTWGKNFGFMPFADYPRGNPYRVMASEDNTNVYFNGAFVATLNKGDIYPNDYTTITPPVIVEPTNITADKPIFVAQYAQKQACAGNNIGDPDMVILNPIEQNIGNIKVFSSTNQAITHQWVNVLLKTTAIGSFTINNAVPSATWQSFVNLPGYSYLRQSLIGLSSATLAADSGFNAICYGFGNVESYAYSAGTNVIDLYTKLGVSSPFNIETTPAVCTGESFKFKISLPYKIDSIDWNFGPAPNPAPIRVKYPPLSPDSTTIVNGKIIYWYSTPSNYNYTTVGIYPTNIKTYSQNTEGCGNVQELDFSLDVSNPPSAAFTNTTPGCIAEQVQFTDQTTGGKPTYKWSWDFGDPGSGAQNTSTLKNPVHTFSTSGNHTVKFSTITTAGCKSSTINKLINVPALPAATISGGATICQNSPPPKVTFIGTDGTAPYIFTYHIIADGVAGPAVNITSAADGKASITPPVGIAGTFVYSLDNIKNSTSALCTTVISGQAVTIKINPLPAAVISGTTAVCLNTPASVLFTGSGSTAPYTFTYTIDNGSGAGTAQTISTTVGNSITLNVPTNVVGNFKYSLVSVKDASSTACTQLQTGFATVTVNPLPTATISSSTEVCLNASSPQVLFIGANATAPYTFTYTIDNGSGPGVAQTIKTTAGNSISLAVPTNIAGTYTYKLIGVKDASSTACSQGQVGSVVIKVDALPDALFNFSSPSCENGIINFDASGSIANVGTITGWQWNFGDANATTLNSNTSSIQKPTHNFLNAGTYTVTLKVSTDKGCESILLSKTVTINPRPNAGFVLPEVCLFDPLAKFTDTSKIIGGGITGWEWSFGDPNATPANPNTSNVQNATHKYIAAGSYQVRLISVTNMVCSDTLTQTLVVNAGNPIADFTLLNATANCANDSVAIQNKSTVSYGSVTKLEIVWDVTAAPSVIETDETPVLDRIYKHKYPDFNTPLTKVYNVRVRAYSGGVCFSDKIQSITLNASPKVQFNTLPNGCIDVPPYELTQASEIAGVPGSGVYSGDGVIMVSPGVYNFNPAVAGSGIHIIKYVFTSSAASCINSASKPVTVYAVPTVNAGPDAGILAGGNITLQPTVTGTGLKYVWSWNNGSIDGGLNNKNIKNPIASPLEDITYTLTVTGTGDCTASDDIFIEVLQAPKIPNTFSPNNDGINDFWVIKYLDTYPNNRVQVFTRTGQKVFESKGYKTPWNGTLNGKSLPVDTYYYIIEPESGRKPITGYVTIIK